MSVYDEKFPNGIGALDPITFSIVVSLCAVADEVRALREALVTAGEDTYRLQLLQVQQEPKP